MAQKVLDMRRIGFSTDQLLTSVFQEVKDIVNTQVHLHETMIRTSELYKTTYTEMTERMKTLEEKLPSVSPALLSLLLDYMKIAATSANENSENGKQKSPIASLPKAKKTRKVKENERQPVAKKSKRPQKRKTKKEEASPAIKPRSDVSAISPTAPQPSPSLLIEPITPPTEPNFNDWLPTESTLNDLWLDYTQLMEDIEQQEKQYMEMNVACDLTAEDPYEEEKLTPLQRNCSICSHNNMLRHVSCHSGQVQCHVCCNELIDCLCDYDPEGRF
ncbi:uncharacterized protein LOC124279596 [Haliotis rubra]|uniref:uncharacterized protein LOC124279596 n=1 Tax=Haliotis rubra TaxID=36100 RepID=UPI001EE57C36|nr:uncharacterized protein LOC124279596 [Haliotis rubra]